MLSRKKLPFLDSYSFINQQHWAADGATPSQKEQQQQQLKSNGKGVIGSGRPSSGSRRGGSGEESGVFSEFLRNDLLYRQAKLDYATSGEAQRAGSAATPTAGRSQFPRGVDLKEAVAQFQGAQSRRSSQQMQFAAGEDNVRPPTVLESLAQTTAIEPKVMLPYIPRPNETPRRIEIERRKRLYAQQDVQKLIAAEGVTILDDKTVEIATANKTIPVLPPPSTDKNSEEKPAQPENKVVRHKPYLSLELFDDTLYEERTPEEWLADGVLGNKQNAIGSALAIAARAYLPDLNIWVSGFVVGYDGKRELWRFKIEDTTHTWKALPTGDLWLPRIMICFTAQDPFRFAKRFAAACRFRAHTEIALRYNLFADCIPALSRDQITQAQIHNIVARIKPKLNLKTDKAPLQALSMEVQQEYARIINKMTLDGAMRDSEMAAQLQVEYPNPEFVQDYETKVAPVSVGAREEIHGMKNFEEFAFATLYSRKETFEILLKFRGECERILSTTIFYTNLNKAVRLDEFEQLQLQSLQNFKIQLQDSWINALKNILKIGLRDLGKGWFNVKESNIEIYNISKLSRFMTVIRFLMQDTLRFLVQNSITEYLKLFAGTVTQRLTIESPMTILRQDRNSADPIVQLFGGINPNKKSLFLVDLSIRNGAIMYNLDTAHLQKVVNALYDKVFAVCEGLPQLEHVVVENITWVSRPMLETMGDQDPFAVKAKERLNHVLQEAFAPLYAYIAKFDKYVPRLTLDIQKFIQEYEKSEKPLSEIDADIQRYAAESELLEKEIPSHISVGMFWVNCEAIRGALRKDLSRALLDMLAKRAGKAASSIIQAFQSIQQKLKERPGTVEDVANIREFMKTVPDLSTVQQNKIEEMLANFDLLEKYRHDLPNEDFKAKWMAIAWPNRIEELLLNTELSLKTEEESFLKSFKNDQELFQERLRSLASSIASFSKFSDVSQVAEVSMEVQKVVAELKECQQAVQVFTTRERLFALEPTKYDEVAQLTKDFEPYKNLWTTTQDWIKWKQTWMTGRFTSLNPDEVEKNLSNAIKVMVKSIKVFKDIPSNLSIANHLRQEMEAFKPYIPLIQALRNPGMKDRHWTKLSEEVGMQLSADDKYTLTELLEKKILSRIDVISKVGDIAGKEYAIESALDKMESEWRQVNLDLQPYRQSGTYVCKIQEEVSRLLDDHIVMTQSMSFSPFKKAFQDRIQMWDMKLRLVQEVLDALSECQRSWLYLEPIFSSEDINRQLPTESKRFATVDRSWRRIMTQAHNNPLVISLCADSKLLDMLNDSNKVLELVSKGLSAYLDSKRLSFPRFFFLSDDELLQILSQTKNPTAVQPHLRKCFENVAKLTFEPDNQITAMTSADGETVPMSEPFYPEGNVEEWLSKVESSMRESIRSTLRKAIVDYLKTPRKEWVQKWPGQVVIAGSQTYWTKEVTEAINGIRPGGLKQLMKDQVRQLEDLVELVRNDLPYITRLILGDLIVIEVHARDVVQRLIDAGVQTENDFEWMSQLRYYWQDEQLLIKIVNATFRYGYEYLGNTGRLVITQLTDRCYLTLTMALSLNMGGAPAGPAGTGKTETVKDLAKALAKQCVVFNCSDQLDYLAMAKFFKGLASAGAWACFDEFNRIDIEVLSVVAQQIMTIQKAVAASQPRFLFEGVDLSLDPTCAIFITMNPGYAGRTELPDNLKALFRPVAMMIPDYTMIAEISLFSFGFSTARVLAEKMVATFRLSSEQLSSQDHYDFGMRAVKTVISSAGNIKRSNPDMPEDLVLLKALMDCNLPKFLVEDVPLFNGIISDLFPGISRPQTDYAVLAEAIRTAALQLNLQAPDSFVLKCIQLYETTVVRHGLMLVGPTGGGKTSCLRVLARALTTLEGQKNPSGGKFVKIQSNTLNPKSITMGQLYGEFDQQTHEWTDGIVPCLVRAGVAEATPDQKWYVFDGPVDAIWIESMNTVLDDNKKLCLVSGEIIKLVPEQKMVFEVDSLAYASPATVSRLGMVFMEPNALGLDPLIESWILRLSKKIPDTVFELVSAKMRKLLKDFLVPSLEFIRKNIKETVTTFNASLCASLLRLVDCFMAPFLVPEEKDHFADEESTGFDVQSLPTYVEPLFLFALVWSVGATSDADGRRKFDQFLREKVSQFLPQCPIPAAGLLYDYKFNPIKNAWASWMENAPAFNAGTGKGVDMIVPTLDTVRYSYFTELLLSNGCHMMAMGPTGTGKSIVISDKIMKGMDEKFIPLIINFSARTSANQTQDFIDSKLDKRRKGVFGPPVGKKMLIFVDDLNMPAVESTGAQPPLELIRQWMDHGGWYDRKQVGRFNELVDITFVVAMGPPGGGRNQISPRLARQFNMISFVDMEDSSLQRIFTTIFNSFLEKNSLGFNALADSITKASITIFNTIRSELLPTPTKSHYTYNMRDLSKIFRGMLGADPRGLRQEADFVRLWSHECMRVFQDRLVDAADREWFSKMLKTTMSNLLGMKWNDVVTNEPLLYGDYLIPGADPKSYQEVKDLRKLVKLVEDYLEDYNATRTPMKLVMFLDAIEHLSRICRIIRQPEGHALLLGVGGSGRQSLSRLATFMEEFELYQIEVAKNYGTNEWREDLKKTMLQAGLEFKPTVFLLADTQIISESCLEDINGILNSGDVPNIYNAEELDRISSGMKAIANEEGIVPTKENLFSIYVSRVKQNLHVVLCMSPIGDAFRNRLRMFPSLVNCCTIDWYAMWPEEALQSVAASFIAEMSDIGSESVVDGVIRQCVFMHERVRQKCVTYKAALNRHNYVTPKSYLELLLLFRKLLDVKKQEIIALRKRTATGLEKLLSATKEVEILQEELAATQPMLIQTSQETEATMEKIAVDKVKAEDIREIISKEEAIASKKAEETKTIADDAKRDLDEALPALDAALESLKNLTKNDVIEIRSMQRPPDGVKLVMEAVCILKGVKPKRVDGDKAGKKVEDYWEPGKALLADPGKFLESLLTFDKDNIPEPVVTKIKPYIDNPDFLPSAIARVSKAATSICQWVRAMEKYYHVSRSVAPKRARLQEAQEQLEVTLKNLGELKARMYEAEVSIKEMEAKYAESVAKKEELGRKVDECNVKLSRASKLIVGLANERSRWAITIEKLDKRLGGLVGDIILASGIAAYLGAFTAEYRSQLVHEWVENMDSLKLPHSETISLMDILGNSLKLRQAEIFGLPKDALSRDNAIIVENSRRWPLFIDPQGQANKWIRNMEKEAGLDIIKLTDKDFLRTLENCIRFGKPCLLENVSNKLDPALEPVLLKQVIKQGNQNMIRLGDALVPLHDDFRFYITTKLPNPHYSPEISATVTLINFTLAPIGLEDQLLAIVVANERPDLEDAKNTLMVQNANMKKELKDLEDKVLFLLSSVQGSPVDDERLIDTLQASKFTSDDIQSKVAAAEQTEKDIDFTRNMYVPVAIRTRILFFCITELSNIDPMYQYSLNWFMGIFTAAIANSEKSDDVQLRVKNLNEYFTFSLYSNVCRSLFEKHKLMFAFLLAVKILMNDDLVNADEWKFLLAGGGMVEKKTVNPAPEWLSSRSWTEILGLSILPAFKGIDINFEKNLDVFKALFDNAAPEIIPIPEPYESKLTPFQKLLLMKTYRPDRMTIAIQNFISVSLGARFIEPQTGDLMAVFKESNPLTPIIFVLSSGADPANSLYKFAEEMRFTKKLTAISLGQGQGPRAEALLRESMERGAWVLLQNCHLSPSWMPSLDKILDAMTPDKVHRDFRLWLTSMPTEKFPVAILQNGLKVTIEPPSGIKANLMRTYASFNEDYLMSCTKVEPWKKLLFSLSFFHAVIQERRKFGPLGWNIPYEFSEGDLRICMRQLKIFLDDYSEVPFKVLKYTAGQINYGGRVTDDWDRRLITNILEDFYNPNVLNDSYAFAKPNYVSVPAGSLQDYRNYLKGLPIDEPTDIFSMDNNANITFAQKEAYLLFENLLLLMPKSSGSGSGKSREEQLYDTAQTMLAKIPKPFDVEAVMKKYPTDYKESMSTVLVQEVIRYNKLLTVIHSTLRDASKALKGLVVMSETLESLCNSIFINSVPSVWSAKAYPSLKPLSSWVADLVARIEFLMKWVSDGIPPVFWISGFFFPQAFLTGVLQNFARKYTLPIDQLSYEFKVMELRLDELKQRPSDGCYIRGLFLEGARWDLKKRVLVPSRSKELYTEMPVIWFLPKANRKKPTEKIYDCPVYKTLLRAGTLSTTGHSTNYVLTIELPSNEPQAHWIKRGVALICALNY